MNFYFQFEIYDKATKQRKNKNEICDMKSITYTRHNYIFKTSIKINI